MITKDPPRDVFCYLVLPSAWTNILAKMNPGGGALPSEIFQNYAARIHRKEVAYTDMVYFAEGYSVFRSIACTAKRLHKPDAAETEEIHSHLGDEH
jgi:hypothetical protein